MNGLYKIKRTLERRNHTTKMKVDARDYHTRLLRMLLLRYYYCYARNNSGTCCTVSFARALGRGGRWASATMAGRVAGAKKLSPLIALLGLLIRRKLPRYGIFTYHVCLTHPFAPERLILWGCVIYHLAHQSCEFRLHSQKLMSPVWSWQQSRLTNCQIITSYRWMVPCQRPRYHVKR